MARYGGKVDRLGGDRAGFFDQHRCRVADLVLGVIGGQKEAQPRGSFCDRRIEDRLDVNAAPEERLREARGCASF